MMLASCGTDDSSNVGGGGGGGSVSCDRESASNTAIAGTSITGSVASSSYHLTSGKTTPAFPYILKCTDSVDGSFIQPV